MVVVVVVVGLSCTNDYVYGGRVGGLWAKILFLVPAGSSGAFAGGWPACGWYCTCTTRKLHVQCTSPKAH